MPIAPIKTLKNRADFLYIRKQEQKWVRPGMVVQSCVRDQDGVRVGFTVTKRVGNAVIRNRVKRRLRSVVQEILSENELLSCDFVVIGRQATIDRSFQDLKGDLYKSLYKLGLLKK